MGDRTGGEAGGQARDYVVSWEGSRETRTRRVAVGTENRSLFQEGHGQGVKTAALWKAKVREEFGDTPGF